jgi:hypothetical protein
LSSPIIVDNAKFASCNAFDVHLDIAECNALNQIKASCGSDAFKIHEWIPSGEYSSMQRFSVMGKLEEKEKATDQMEKANTHTKLLLLLLLWKIYMSVNNKIECFILFMLI